jgi:hypothetical protein
MIFYQLFRPFAFMFIKSEQLRVLRLFVPGIITAVLLILYYFLPVRPEIIGDKKYLDYLLQIVGILPGFYIAALAAAATFSNPSLDEPMLGADAPVIDLMRGGQVFEVRMTMRIFMCHLFSYLSAMSFVTSLVLLSCIEVYPSIKYLQEFAETGSIAAGILHVLCYASVGVATYLFWMIIIVTMHGLYFLVERMHQENR